MQKPVNWPVTGATYLEIANYDLRADFAIVRHVKTSNFMVARSRKHSKALEM